MSSGGLVGDDDSTKWRIGRRLTVYWDQHDTWYKGTVASKIVCMNNNEENDDKDSTSWVLIDYDDGDSDWMDINRTKFRVSDKFIKHETVNLEKKKVKISRLTIGSRLSIWWPEEKEYYTGTLSEIDSDLIEESTKRNSTATPYRTNYDDGDEEWVNLLHRKFTRVRAKASRLGVGSRVSVYIRDKNRHYGATVTKIEPELPRPHRVKYDADYEDIGGKVEWLNLNVHPFLDIKPPNSDNTPTVNAKNLKKRKLEFLTYPTADDNANPCQKRRQAPNRASVYKEVCVVCRSAAARVRAAPCHHILCRRCIRCNSNQHDPELLCPICEAEVPFDQLVKYDKDHVSFRGVEALERTTAEVVHTFSSASAATVELSASCSSTMVPSRIIEACQSKRRDDREYQGYYWRFQGSKDRILRIGEGIKEGIAVEQVDIATGEVMETFPSGRKASEKTGVCRCSIRRVLERRGKAVAGGFFWRYEGETHGPWPDPEHTNFNPVEQLDYETGDFLAEYILLAEAKKAMGMRSNAGCIRDVCNGKGRATAKGFFWRWKGSKRLPNHMMGVKKIMQIRKSKNGKVIKEFLTSREAQSYFGHQCCWSTLCRYCREKGYYYGYYWQYRMLRERIRPEEAIIGKRLRVKQPSDEWLEGKITKFRTDSGKHEIQFDSGVVEHRRLSSLEYEWKNDQGQKPVEQLDLKTGEIIATHDSLSDAATSIGIRPLNSTGIVAVCQGRVRSASGFFWRYKGSDALPPKPKGRRKVEQLCLRTGRVLETFDSISAAGRALGITTPGISYCCNGRNHSKSAGGFGWRFHEGDTD